MATLAAPRELPDPLTNAPGVRGGDVDNLGMRGTASHDLVYDNVDAGSDARLPSDSGGNPKRNLRLAPGTQRGRLPGGCPGRP